MPVFISYSHQDKNFVDRLATQLVRHKTHVWVDTWELNVGDSIIGRVQSAIKSASALIVVLSRASVQSEWCKKELAAGLVRELEEKRVVVLPALIEECDIPLFLQDKIYADFRQDYDKGFRATLDAIAKVTSEQQGRVESPDFNVDWSMDWGDLNGRFALRITIVQHGEAFPYCVVTEIMVTPNDAGAARHAAFEDRGIGWFARCSLVDMLTEAARSMQDCRVVIEDVPIATHSFGVMDPKMGLKYEIDVSCRRLGEDTGKDTLVDWGRQLGQMRDALRAATRKLTPEEMQTVLGMTGLG